MYDVPMTNAETFNTRHLETGKLQRLTADQISVFSDVLEIVPDDAKPLVRVKGGTLTEPDAPTQEIADAQAAYQLLLDEGHAPNSKIVREAKEAVDKSRADYEKEAEAATRRAEEATNQPGGDAQ